MAHQPTAHWAIRWEKTIHKHPQRARVCLFRGRQMQIPKACLPGALYTLQLVCECYMYVLNMCVYASACVYMCVFTCMCKPEKNWAPWSKVAGSWIILKPFFLILSLGLHQCSISGFTYKYASHRAILPSVCVWCLWNPALSQGPTLVGSPSLGRAISATVQQSFMTLGKDRWAGGGVRTGNFTHGRLAPGSVI